MSRLLAFVVAATAFVAFTFALTIAQEEEPAGDNNDGTIAIITNELGTPCASLPASPVATLQATPEGSPWATPGAIVLTGCITEATPGAE